ncbi:N-methylhydantoinase A [Catenulispora sp. GP43]|uniref:hydantoinase/oxoprolinase family protein n=1 Tax=Catenulispora sp. GP43 TaxID=3156263 RepID=UPI003515F2CD
MTGSGGTRGTTRIGVDVGGTFTDLVLHDPVRGLTHTGKLPTTPEAPGRAVVEGLRRLLAETTTGVEDVAEVVHGTTLVTNTVLERTGAKVGLLTTEGFRDILEMGREIRHDSADLFARPAPPIVPRRLRLGVPGRMSAAGTELTPLDEDAVLTAARLLLDTEGVEALAVGFLHSHANPGHERRARDLIRRLAPDLAITLSCEAAPEIGEHERFNTACVNAYVQPVVREYLGRLEADLRASGFAGRLSIMLSGGGLCTVAHASAFPVALLESGPAAGAIAAARVAVRSGEPRVVAFDMGGTTAKLSLIEDGRPRLRHDFEAGRLDKFAPGSGLPLKLTVVDMIEIGAGGGSLAEVDRLGLLKVGPRSAGALPGPIAYGRGGTRPTVTDADLLAGRLDPERFLGGEMALDAAAVRAGLAELGRPVGRSAADAADGVEQIVTATMAAAARTHLAERGRDPRDFTLVAFGGAGPVHAYRLAKLLKLRRIIVPAGAGVMSAFGFLAAVPSADAVRAHPCALTRVDWSRVAELYKDMESQVRGVLGAEADAEAEPVVLRRAADMRYLGQGFQITVPLPDGDLSDDGGRIREAFARTYASLYGRVIEDGAPEVVSWRLSGNRPGPPTLPDHRPEPAGPGPAGPGPRSRRTIRFPDLGDVEAAVHDRGVLAPGTVIRGPAVFEDRETSCAVGPDCLVTVDTHHSLVIDIEPSEGGMHA